MVSVASQLVEEINARAQSDSLEDAWEICADGTYFQNTLLIMSICICVFVRSIYVCSDTFCEPDMTSVRRHVVCVLGVCVQSVGCVCDTAGLF